MRRTGRWLLAGVVLALNLGCASVMRVDSQVESHARWDTAALPASTASYVFERTPSQAGAALADSQTALETLAAEVRSDAQTLETELAQALDQVADFDSAVGLVRKLRFLDKLEADIGDVLEALLF